MTLKKYIKSNQISCEGFLYNPFWLLSHILVSDAEPKQTFLATTLKCEHKVEHLKC